MFMKSIMNANRNLNGLTKQVFFSFCVWLFFAGKKYFPSGKRKHSRKCLQFAICTFTNYDFLRTHCQYQADLGVKVIQSMALRIPLPTRARGIFVARHDVASEVGIGKQS